MLSRVIKFVVEKLYAFEDMACSFDKVGLV